MAAVMAAALIVPARASAGRPKRNGTFVVDRGRVRFHETIKSRHRFVVHHDQGSADVTTTVRSGKLLRKGLRRAIAKIAGGGTESRGAYFREGPLGVAHSERSSDHVIVLPGEVREVIDRKPLVGGPIEERRTTAAGARATKVERQSLFERYSSSILGETVRVGHEQTEHGAGVAVSRETATSLPRRISRITAFDPGGVSRSQGTVDKHGRTVRRDLVQVTDRDGHRVEQFLRRNGRERKRIETWAGHDGVTTTVITRYRRNGSRWMTTTLRSDRDGAKKPERVFYRRDGLTPRQPLFERH